MKRNYTGCAICDSTWGDVWEEVDGERMFFCCATCAVQFRRLVGRIREATGWPLIEALEIGGDRRGRSWEARTGSATARGRVSFTAEGEILRFEASGQT